jgi:hypothetical protein
MFKLGDTILLVPCTLSYSQCRQRGNYDKIAVGTFLRREYDEYNYIIVPSLGEGERFACDHEVIKASELDIMLFSNILDKEHDDKGEE